MTEVDRAEKRRRSWRTARIAFALCALFTLTLFSIGQATTFAWLSTSPAQAQRLESLQWKFWSYAALSLVLLAIELSLVWIALGNAHRRRKRRRAAFRSQRRQK
jgi:hypothetical protein